MEIYFKLPKSIIKMKDRIDVERNGYLTTSSLNGEKKCPLINYGSEERALEILNAIDKVISVEIEKNKKTIFIDLPIE